MSKITYKLFDDPFFLSAFSNIANTQSKKYLQKRIGRFISDYTNKYEIYLEEKEELQYKHAVLNSEGEPVVQDLGNGNGAIKFKDKKAFMKEFKELQKKEIVFEELKESWLKDVKLSNGQFSAIVPILVLDVDDDALEQEEKAKEEKAKK